MCVQGELWRYSRRLLSNTLLVREHERVSALICEGTCSLPLCECRHNAWCLRVLTYRSCISERCVRTMTTSKPQLSCSRSWRTASYQPKKRTNRPSPRCWTWSRTSNERRQSRQVLYLRPEIKMCHFCQKNNTVFTTKHSTHFHVNKRAYFICAGTYLLYNRAQAADVKAIRQALGQHPSCSPLSDQLVPQQPLAPLIFKTRIDAEDLSTSKQDRSVMIPNLETEEKHQSIPLLLSPLDVEPASSATMCSMSLGIAANTPIMPPSIHADAKSRGGVVPSGPLGRSSRRIGPRQDGQEHNGLRHRSHDGASAKRKVTKSPLQGLDCADVVLVEDETEENRDPPSPRESLFGMYSPSNAYTLGCTAGMRGTQG